MQNARKFVLGEVISLAVSYLAGWSASWLVSLFFVKRGIGNLWGLATKREAVSKDTYEWLMFFGSYLVGLIVMLLVNRLIHSFKKEDATPSE